MVVMRTRRGESMMELAEGDSNVEDYARSMACDLLDSRGLVMNKEVKEKVLVKRARVA